MEGQGDSRSTERRQLNKNQEESLRAEWLEVQSKMGAMLMFNRKDIGG